MEIRTTFHKKLREIQDDVLIMGSMVEKAINRSMEALVKRADSDPYVSYFVLIRCPNDLPYHRIIHIITKISDTTYRNVKYGCVGGTVEDIQNCKRIATVVERDAKGRRRKNIRIDF